MESNKIKIKILPLSIIIILITETTFWIAVSEKVFLHIPALGIARLIEAILLCLIVIKFGDGISSIGLEPAKWLIGLKKGIIWSVAFGVCAAIGFAILFAVHLDPFKMMGTGLRYRGTYLILFFLVGGLISPITEEIFFRGIIYGFLRRWGVVLAIIGTTLLFALAHFRNSSLPLTQVIGGFVFAIAYEREANLVVPIVIHVLGNMAIFTILIIV